MKNPIWSGMFGSFAEANCERQVFESTEWASRMEDRVAALLKRKTASPVSIPELAAIVAWMMDNKDEINILDFGGGMGADCLEVMATLPGARGRLQFHIVETMVVAKRARELVRDISALSFYETLPELERVDLIHAGSVLHYVENWREVLRRFVKYQPAGILFTDLPVGDIPESFVTVQDYHGIGIPVWFLPRLEFVSEMEKLGFHLAFQSAFEGTYRGLTSPPMDGFPPTHRIPYFSNLLFRSVSQKPTNV